MPKKRHLPQNQGEMSHKNSRKKLEIVFPRTRGLNLSNALLHVSGRRTMVHIAAFLWKTRQNGHFNRGRGVKTGQKNAPYRKTKGKFVGKTVAKNAKFFSRKLED